jgi:predicted phage-related endonuclease
MSDFSPEVRNSAIWSGDSRKVANGKAAEVVLTKQGKMEIPDLSGIEAVRMGLVMQPLIGRLAQDKLQMELKDADYSLSHRNEPWMRSHFDFISADGFVLVEAKNYAMGSRAKFDSDNNIIPAADYAQLVHECSVHGIERIVLAVLFGGQEFVTFDFQITEAEKEELIKKMAKVWGHVQAGTLPEPDSIEAAKLIYPHSNDNTVIANSMVEQHCLRLKQLKDAAKELDTQIDASELVIRNAMGEASALSSLSGDVLATWKTAKASKRFNADMFRQAMPDIYDSFVMESPGSRRFLIK